MNTQNICMEKGIQNTEQKHPQHTMQNTDTAKIPRFHRHGRIHKLFSKRKQAWMEKATFREGTTANKYGIGLGNAETHVFTLAVGKNKEG